MVNIEDLQLNSNLQPLQSLPATRPKIVDEIEFRNRYRIPAGFIDYYKLSDDSRPHTAIVSLSGEKGTFKSVQEAISYVNRLGGGIVFVKAGTYSFSENVSMFSNVALIGEYAGGVVFDFGTGNRGILAAGGDLYSTGTLSATEGSTAVTGSSTSWEANVTVNHSLIINGRTYPISSVNSDTSITLDRKFDQDDVSGATYTAAELMENVIVKNINIIDSNSTAINFNYAKGFLIENITIEGATSQGVVVGNSTEFMMSSIYVNDLFAVGVSVADSNSFYCKSVYARSLSDYGVQIDDCYNGTLTDIQCFNSSSSGIYFDTSYNIALHGYESSYNQDGVILVGCERCFVSSGSNKSNSRHGLLLDLLSSKNIIHGNISDSNTSYGILVNNANCGTNVITSNIFEGNGTTVSDKGTGTIIRANGNLHDNDYDVGLGTVAAAASIGTITFSYLGGTPETVVATPTNSLGSASEYFVDTIGTTTFNINLDTAPGTAVVFNWRVDNEKP